MRSTGNLSSTSHKACRSEDCIDYVMAVSLYVYWKAFDRINHITLFTQLGVRGVPGYTLRIQMHWYKNQDMCLRCGDVYSAKFKVTHCIRRRGYYSITLSMHCIC